MISIPLFGLHWSSCNSEFGLFKHCEYFQGNRALIKHLWWPQKPQNISVQTVGITFTFRTSAPKIKMIPPLLLQRPHFHTFIGPTCCLFLWPGWPDHYPHCTMALGPAELPCCWALDCDQPGMKELGDGRHPSSHWWWCCWARSSGWWPMHKPWKKGLRCLKSFPRFLSHLVTFGNIWCENILKVMLEWLVVAFLRPKQISRDILSGLAKGQIFPPLLSETFKRVSQYFIQLWIYVDQVE